MRTDLYEEICGCTKGRHSVICVRRGRDKMTKAQYDADVAKEKDEKRAEELADLREEAAEQIEALQAKAEQYAIIGKTGIEALKALRPMIRELAELTAGELRALFGEDLAPLGKAADDAILFVVNRSAEQKAELLKRLMTSTGLSEATCLALVLSSHEVVSAAIKNALDGSGDKKKK